MSAERLGVLQMHCATNNPKNAAANSRVMMRQMKAARSSALDSEMVVLVKIDFQTQTVVAELMKGHSRE